jgi:16S rRNA (guanine966-N2)-methyltransferase
MRIIGGQARGRRIATLKGMRLRPTADRVKEALFSILTPDLEGARVLDLFAGSGNLSLEALSRGAASALLVDSSREAGQLIERNLADLGFLDRSTVWVKPVSSALRQLGGRRVKYDMVFVDPPYDEGWLKKVLLSIDERRVLEERGIVVAEHSRREEVADRYGSLAIKHQRAYGDTRLSFFEVKRHS